MEQTTFHKQKLYALIAAGVALVALFLPWISISASFGEGMKGLGAGIGGSSVNGMRDWGMLSFAGVIGVAALTLMGNKAVDYTADFRKYVMIAFGVIALGAILFWATNNARAGGGSSEFFEVKVRTGIGLWLCIIAGLGGLALVYGLIKLDKKPL